MRTQVVEGLNLLTKDTASMVEKSDAPILYDGSKNFIDDDALDFVRQMTRMLRVKQTKRWRITPKTSPPLARWRPVTRN